MKKIFLVLSLIVFTASLSFAEISLVPKISVDIPSSIIISETEDAKRGFDLSLELRGTISKWFMWNAGASYMFDRGIEGYGSETDFSFLPVYGSLMFTPFSDFRSVRPYVKANLGYDVLASNKGVNNIKGGLYYGGALGVEYKSIVAEIYGAHHLATYDAPEKSNIKYVQIGLALGYKFVLKKY